LCNSLNQQSQSSIARRQASHTTIQDELVKKADLEAIEEKRSMDNFVKNMRDQFPEVTDKTQREIVEANETENKPKIETDSFVSLDSFHSASIYSTTLSKHGTPSWKIETAK
uniref:Reverse transcriptase domain-containing protein n=2 Tax=Toxocara canis TaxID=6265 RepID=A0A183V981_TOXCA